MTSTGVHGRIRPGHPHQDPLRTCVETVGTGSCFATKPVRVFVKDAREPKRVSRRLHTGMGVAEVGGYPR